MISLYGKKLKFVGMNEKEEKIATSFYEKARKDEEMNALLKEKNLSWGDEVIFNNVFGKDDEKKLRKALMVYEGKNYAFLRIIKYWNREINKKVKKEKEDQNEKVQNA